MVIFRLKTFVFWYSGLPKQTKRCMYNTAYWDAKINNGIPESAGFLRSRTLKKCPQVYDGKSFYIFQYMVQRRTQDSIKNL